MPRRRGADARQKPFGKYNDLGGGGRGGRPTGVKDQQPRQQSGESTEPKKKTPGANRQSKVVGRMQNRYARRAEGKSEEQQGRIRERIFGRLQNRLGDNYKLEGGVTSDILLANPTSTLEETYNPGYNPAGTQPLPGVEPQPVDVPPVGQPQQPTVGQQAMQGHMNKRRMKQVPGGPRRPGGRYSQEDMYGAGGGGY